MAWLSIILAIIQAIPTIIKIIQMIRDLLKNQPKEVRAQYAARLDGILTRWKEHKDSVRATSEVKDVLADLEKHVGGKGRVA